jgi:hypothetical protein
MYFSLPGAAIWDSELEKIDPRIAENLRDIHRRERHSRDAVAHHSAAIQRPKTVKKP